MVNVLISKEIALIISELLEQSENNQSIVLYLNRRIKHAETIASRKKQRKWYKERKTAKIQVEKDDLSDLL